MSAPSKKDVLAALDVLRAFIESTSNPAATTFDFGDGNGAVPAHRHTNTDGSIGGWVADTASVASTAYVGQNARVYGNATVSGNALVYGNALVCDSARVGGNAIVYGNAKVSGNAIVGGNDIVYGNA